MDQCGGNKEVCEVSEQLEKSLSIDTEDNFKEYNRLNSEGKRAAKEGDIKKALDLFKRAYKLYQTPKLECRIKKIEEVLTQTNLEDEDDEFVNVNNSGLLLYRELYDKLYDYQRDGVSFLYGLYRDGRKGGVLADDMGLGKTIQVISFLSGMYDNELAKNTLLIMPTSLITNWTKEFSKWTPGMRVKQFHGTSKTERSRDLEKVQRRGGVIITTYTMLMNNWQQMASYQGREFVWDYMILDEAHKIKNSSTKTAKSAYAIPSKNRVLLTGTPVQNNLKEMWTLFDFACQGSLLGTAKTFKSEYENPITRARERDATPGEKVLGSRMSENLMVLINPYYLRRTKAEVQQKRKEEGSNIKDEQDARERSHSGAVMPQLTRKNDLIVWTYLSVVQEAIYRQFIELDHIKELLMTTRSPLAELTILKKLCDHPRLLSANAAAKLGLEESPEDEFQSDTTDTNDISNLSDQTLISESGKLVFLLALLERLREEGHRTLVFAHYRKVLDIIERILGNRGFKVLRLDGTITQLAERERLITLFQTNRKYSVFLLTTQVGGVGITLTAANRVVIYDPSWNPATDAQAVDRAYRIGQTDNVVIYRLITCGTVEEKIYRRQVFKDSLIRQNTGDKKNPFRYFSRQELKELFLLEDPHTSSTQLQLQALHSRHRQTDPGLDEHIAHLHAMHMFGISDHDLMFSLDVHHDDAPENQEEQQYIEGRVQKAQELMRAESELQVGPKHKLRLLSTQISLEFRLKDALEEEQQLQEDTEEDLETEEEEQQLQEDTEEDLETEEEEQQLQEDTEEDLETEEEEQKLLSQLQTTGTFDVLRSLSESQNRRASGLDQSVDESIVMTSRKKRRAVIYDSEEEEEEEEEEAPLSDLFPVLGASTPKSASSPQRRRKSVGNLTVASQRSLLRSIMDEDVQEDQSSDEDDESGSDSEEEEAADDEDQISSTHEEDEENLEESSAEPELGSGEKMDCCAAESSGEPETYESLVLKGKECYSRARLDQALSFFLRAIDMKPGDPEVQILTIQLYRQLTQKQ
ncbi:DNA excision repair protein ERCC-6-like [Austrofundulus limnaeus]|uniref:DNA excision repair protein ERCC-6-like n=1 Tax=Austrofundulus limnaeus TaxID=52670 RepID=A0A2I4CE01_AUSLI|nr:PREDICTED: DNA excision repair protein ERCC-6-like [Austrofundulus limnaeus]